jgi:8-oxo-dGTP diphosphatase
MQQSRPLVGIGVLVINSAKEVLLLKRIGSHGSGEWSAPGGHLEFGESFEECASKELYEETGLTANNFRLVSISNDRRYIEESGRHYVTVGLQCDLKSGEAKIMEPSKATQIGWFSLQDLPTPLFQGTERIIEAYASGTVYNSLP